MYDLLVKCVVFHTMYYSIDQFIRSVFDFGPSPNVVYSTVCYSMFLWYMRLFYLKRSSRRALQQGHMLIFLTDVLVFDRVDM